MFRKKKKTREEKWERDRRYVSYLTSGQVPASLVKLVYAGGESLEIRDDELLAERLGQEHDVALDTSEEGEKETQWDDDNDDPLNH